MNQPSAFVPPDPPRETEPGWDTLVQLLQAGHAPYSLLAGHCLLFLQPLLALLGIALPGALADRLNGWSSESSQEQRVP